MILNDRYHLMESDQRHHDNLITLKYDSEIYHRNYSGNHHFLGGDKIFIDNENESESNRSTQSTVGQHELFHPLQAMQAEFVGDRSQHHDTWIGWRHHQLVDDCYTLAKMLSCVIHTDGSEEYTEKDG